MLPLLLLPVALAGGHLDDAQPDGHSNHAEHTPWHGDNGLATDSLGVKWVTVSAFVEDEVHTFHGAGLFMEHEFIEGWELELSVPLLRGQEAWLLPVDLVLKRSYHPTQWLAPFVGVGPIVDLVFSQEKGLVAAPGLTAIGGTFIWFGHTIGLDIEASYSLVWEPGHGLINEVGFGAGPVIHF